MQTFECWICFEVNALQAVRIKVRAKNKLHALREVARLYRPARLLGMPFLLH